MKNIFTKFKKSMKKLLLIIMAINFAACSDENTEKNALVATAPKGETFNPDPTPADYLKANYPKYMETLDLVTKSQKANTAKTAAFVNTYVPDANFRSALITAGAALDAVPGDNYIEINNATAALNLANKGIANFTGINSFTSLIQLSVAYNINPVTGTGLTALDISGLTNLIILECQENKLTTLNLSTNTKLAQIWCHKNELTSLTLPSSTNLWGVWCYENQLTTLNLNGNIGITDLFTQKNNLTSFNFAPFINLKKANVSNNKWVTVNFDANGQLTALWCFSNTLLQHLYMRNAGADKIVTQDFRFNRSPNYIHVHSLWFPGAATRWPVKNGIFVEN